MILIIVLGIVSLLCAICILILLPSFRAKHISRKKVMCFFLIPN